MIEELNAVVHVELEPIVKLRCSARNCKHHMTDQDCCNYKILNVDENGVCLSHCVDGEQNRPNKSTRYAKIKIGALVDQDHRSFMWPGAYSEGFNKTFQIGEKINERFKLVAEGFGLHPGALNYGNGALYVLEKDLIYWDDCIIK